MTGDLPEAAAEWENTAVDDRLSYAQAWDNYAGSVRALIHEYHSGELTPRQEARFFALLHRLHELRPLFERLPLRWTDVSPLEMAYKPHESRDA